MDIRRRTHNQHATERKVLYRAGPTTLRPKFRRDHLLDQLDQLPAVVKSTPSGETVVSHRSAMGRGHSVRPGGGICGDVADYGWIIIAIKIPGQHRDVCGQRGLDVTRQMLRPLDIIAFQDRLLSAGFGEQSSADF